MGFDLIKTLKFIAFNLCLDSTACMSVVQCGTDDVMLLLVCPPPVCRQKAEWGEQILLYLSPHGCVYNRHTMPGAAAL